MFGKKFVVNLSWVQDREFSLVGALMYVERDRDDTTACIAQGKMKMEPLMSRVFPFDEYQDAFKYIEDNKDTSLKILVEM